MKWIQNFSNSKIPFYIYELNKGDYITYTIGTLKNKYIIILYGIAYIIKIFSNKETIILGILEKNNIIKEPKYQMYGNYSIIAIQKTFLLSFTWQDIIKNQNIQLSLLNNILISYNQTLYKYEKMVYILSHKSAKNRIIQLILFLSQEFCIIQNNYIVIPFYISQTTMSTIIGSNKSTVNKIMHELCNFYMISYLYDKYICIQDPLKLSYCYKNKQN